MKHRETPEPNRKHRNLPSVYGVSLETPKPENRTVLCGKLKKKGVPDVD